MANFSNCAITSVGRSLIARSQAESKALIFTKCQISSKDYSALTLDSLEALEDVEQEVPISEKQNENNKVTLTAIVDNTNLVTGYYFYTYGYFAKVDGDQTDTLVLVAATSTPDYVPAISETMWSSVIDSIIEISNADNVTILANPTVIATQQYVQDYMNSAKQLSIPITGWIEATDPKGKTYYYQTFTVNGLKSSYTPIISRKGNDIYDVTDESDMQKAYNCLSEYECGENTITLFAHKVPTTAFTILLKGVGV